MKNNRGLPKSVKCAGCGEAIRAGTKPKDFEVVDKEFYHARCVNIERVEPEEHTDEGPIAKPTEPVINVGTADSTAIPVNFVGGWYSQSVMAPHVKPSENWQFRLDSVGREHARHVGKSSTRSQAQCDDEDHSFCDGCPKEKTCHARPFPTHSAWRAWAHAEIGTNRDPAQRDRFMQPDWADIEKWGPLGVKAKPKPLAENQDERKGPPLYKGSPTPAVIPDSAEWIEEQKPAKEVKPFVPLDLKPRGTKEDGCPY